MRNICTAVAGVLVAGALGFPAVTLAQSPRHMSPTNGGINVGDPYRIEGRIDSDDGHDRLRIGHTEVLLHQGTRIYPTRATLRVGLFVQARGHWSKHHLDADEIRIIR